MTLTAVSTNLSVLGSADMEMMVWNIVLTAVVGIMGFLLKGKFDDLDRISILLNKTREEVARERGLDAGHVLQERRGRSHVS